MVAACISADTGVGPAIASGSQVNSGICADLPVAPTNNNKVISSMLVLPDDMVAALPKNLGKAYAAKRIKYQEHTDQET